LKKSFENIAMRVREDTDKVMTTIS